jgi:hypothetical protein
MAWQDGAMQLSNLIGIGIPAIKYKFELFIYPSKLNVIKHGKQGMGELNKFKWNRDIN